MIKVLITIVIPCYRSAKTLERVVTEAKDEILRKPGYDYQFILVNDCSPDNTFEVIQALASNDHKITGIDLARNYGQNAARLAAVPYIRGDVAICMDDDGQHPAEQIYRLVDKIKEGYDLVYVHFTTQRQTAFRRFASHMNTKLLDITGSKLKGVYNSPYLAWSRFSIDALKNYHSPFISAGAFLTRCTSRITNIEAEQRQRMEGHSGYTLTKLLNLWLVEITNFSIVPLRFAGVLGAFSSLIGVLLGIFIIIAKLAKPSIQAGYTSMMAGLLVIGGIIMLMLGLMGEYIGKIYMTISNQPQYVIRTVLNASKSTKEINTREII